MNVSDPVVAPMPAHQCPICGLPFHTDLFMRMHAATCDWTPAQRQFAEMVAAQGRASQGNLNRGVPRHD